MEFDLPFHAPAPLRLEFDVAGANFVRAVSVQKRHRDRAWSTLCQGTIARVDGNQVIVDDRLEPIEPERGDLRQHLALIGDPRAQDVVEGGDAIGGDDQQAVAEVVDVTHLAVTIRAA